MSLLRAGRPRVTVVIPCHDYGRFLSDSVNSALSQPAVDVDVLVLDDASTDDSPLVAARLARADERVEVVRHRRNHGHVATFNEGLERATGDYVALLSADDLLAPGALRRATAVMEAHPEVGLVYGHPRVFRGTEVPAPRCSPPGVRIWIGADWIRAQCNRGASCIYSPEACVRAAVQRAVGGYNPALPHSGDLEMWLRIASVAAVARVNAEQAYKRVHGEGMIQTSFPRRITDLRLRHEAYESFFAGPGRQGARAPRDRALARRRLAAEAIDHACLALRGAVDPSDLDEYVRFARALVGADVVRLSGWREYRMLRSGVGPTPGRPGPGGPRLERAFLRGCELRRAVAHRHRWWRWRLTGV